MSRHLFEEDPYGSADIQPHVRENLGYFILQMGFQT
jgi:hypothetical protein